MKRILFALTLLALVLPAVPRANGDELSVDLFYDNLSGGSWIEVGDYGYGWQPDVAASDSDWRPYADGYWAYTDYGWTWVSYEDFGWACYHYGRWARLADYGWVWFPGNDLEWGPAWVSWRTGGDQIGWAPLPPRGPGIVYEGRPIGGRVDIEFDIGPAYYNFIDIRFIGEPVLRSHIYAPSYNVTYINQTVNVTNITVKNKVVYNYGPDYDVLVKHSNRPIQKLKIEREKNVDFVAAGKSGGLKNKVQGDKLVLAAPPMIQKSNKKMAPPTVKTRVAKDKVKLERGWSNIGDAKAEADLKQKMKTEDLKKVPPPTAGAAAGGSPETSATPLAKDANSPFEKGKGKGKHDEQLGGSPSVPEPMNPPGSSAMTPHPGEHKGKQLKPLPPESAPPSGEPIETPQATPFTGKPKEHLGRKLGPSPSEPGGVSDRTNLNSSKSNTYRSMPASPGETSSELPKVKGKGKAQEPGVPVPPDEMNPALQKQGGKRAKQFEPGGNASGGPGADAQRGGGRHEGKKKGEKESPTPAP